MESLATYSEVRFDGSRVFTLLPDKIIVHGKQSLRSEFETAIALTCLNPNPDKLFVRNPSFFGGLWMAIVSFVVCCILISGFGVSLEKSAPVLLIVLGLAGVVLMLATFRKVEFVRFKNDGGIVLSLISHAQPRDQQSSTHLLMPSQSKSVLQEVWPNWPQEPSDFKLCHYRISTFFSGGHIFQHGAEINAGTFAGSG